nr:reverse transcriptase domain-containing protein [Tanacetum cinerariifolium]
MTWDNLVSKFINQFFPPSKTTNLRNQITRSKQRFDESFYEAWDHFNDLLRACPQHGFSELHQLDTFYNALNVNDRDSLNSAAGGNFLDKMPLECLKIIESKSKVRQSRANEVVAKVSTSSSTPIISSEVAELKDLVRALLLDKKNQSSAPVPSSTPTPVKKVEPNCVTCGGSGTLPSNTITNPKEELKGITTRSGVAYQGPTIPSPSKVVKQGTEVTKDQVQIPSSQISASMPNVKSSIPYPSRRDNERRRDQANEQIEKFYEIFKDMSFDISFSDALILMPKFASTLKALIGNKEKLSEMEVLGFFDVTASGNPTPHDDPIVYTTSLTLTPFRDSDFLLFEEDDAFLSLEDDPNSPKINPFYYDPEGDILLLKAILNSKPLHPLPNHEHYLPSFKNELKVCEAKTVKSSVDEPPEVKLKDLPLHLEYAFLEGDNKLPVIIAKELGDEEKSALIKVLKSHMRAIAWKLSDIQGKDNVHLSLWNVRLSTHAFQFVQCTGHVQRCMLAIFHDMVEKTMEVFMDDFLIFGNSFENCLSCLDKMLQRSEDTNLSLNLENSRFFQNFPTNDPSSREEYSVYFLRRLYQSFPNIEEKLMEAPILIAPNWDLPFELMCDANDFATCTVLGQRHEKHFKPIHYASKTMKDAESNYTTTEKEMLAVVYAFEKFRSYLIMNKSIVHTDHSALKYLFAKKDAKARLLRASWFADFANYHAGNFIVKGNKHILVAVDYLSKWVEAKALPTNDARVVCKFLKSLFARFGSPRAIISDRDTHFCNDQFAKVMLKYGVTHRLSTAYHPQTSGQIEVSNRGLKRILERTIGATRIWLEKEPPRSIFTWDDLVLKFINQFFPSSKTTNLRNEITLFQQRFDEFFSEAWYRFKDLLRACPHHGFSELHQLDTFYNALNSKDQDSLNSAAGGNFLDKMPRECLAIIESKSKVHYSHNKPIVAKVSTTTSTSGVSPNVPELKDMVKALLLDKKPSKSCVTCGGAHSYRNCPATDGNTYCDNIQEFVSQASAVNFNQENTSYHPPMMSNQIRPPGFPPVPNNQNVQRNNQNRFIPNQNRGNNFNQGPVYQPLIFQPPVYQAPAYQALTPQTQGVSREDFSAYVKANDAFVNSNSASTSSSGTLPSNTIANPKSDLKAITTRSGVSYDGPQILPLPSSLPKVVENKPEVTKDTVNPTNNGNTKDVQPQAVQSESSVLISKPVTSPISEPAIAPVSASKPNPKASIPYPSRRNNERNPLIGNKEKLSEMARTPLNEHCSVVLLKKLLEKLGDPGKFLIPCDFPGMVECLALADLGDSINLMPFSIWKRLSLLDLTPTCMTLELADRSISHPVRVAEDVYVKVGSFYFPADFVAVDFDADPRVPLNLGRSFLKTGRALIDVFEGELTLRVGKEAITFILDQTSRYSANYSDMTAKRIDITDMACEEYSHEVLGFSDTISSGNPTPYYDPIVSATSSALTLFGNSDFLLEEELKICEAKSDKSSVDEPPTIELKDLAPYLEYAFLEGDNKLPVIISKDLSVEEKTAFITVLKSYKRAIAWKLSDIKGINPEFGTHKILIEEDFEPTVQH